MCFFLFLFLVLFICSILDIYYALFPSVDQAAEESEETEDQAMSKGKVFIL